MTSWPALSETSSKTNELSVLLTEDDPDVARYLATVLKTLGHEVIGVAGDGSEAIRLARELSPDLILMDIDLPGMDGVSAASKILETLCVPVIICTGRSDSAALESARHLEIQAYLNKPFSAIQLRSAILVALTQHRRQYSARREITELRVALEKGGNLPDTAVLSVERLLTIGLTPREAEVLHWVAQGKSNGDVATILKASPRTVAKHVEHIFTKLNVESRTAAVAEARRLLREG
ncbi:MAG TPA: DNA-binding response regulator [Chthoniobacteraceae bacterium]|nr:DNA-binding response regulator [Chthoniobacteraceae bacterium]